MLNGQNLPFLLVLTVLVSWPAVEAAMVSVCSDIKDCAGCTQSYVHIFSFREYCRWCISTNTCGGPLSCPAGVATAQRDAFKCPTPATTAKGYRYTDKLGRSLYSLNMAAMQEDPTKCIQNSRSDVKFIKRFEVECDQTGNTCAGYLAISEEAKAIYVVYRGSTFNRQLFQEFVQGIGAQLGAWEKFINGSGVMTYFYGGFRKLFLQTEMKAQLDALNKKYENYRIWVTGHSLGGSLASITALYLANSTAYNANKIRLVTFGEPRTGNYLYAKTIEENLKFRYRVVNRNDIVTNVPASMDPDNLLLTVATAERQPYYYRYLVHYDKGMDRNADFKICESSEDHHCRNLGLAVDVSDHEAYFGVKADAYIKAGCPKAMIM
uniref:Lipase_3 domain-containing protein n=1 Tax=Panagrellus redivivus TaxID=6233 RepID=A0A7E4USU0_PANRE